MKAFDHTELHFTVLENAEMENQRTDADFKGLFYAIQDSISDCRQILIDIQENQARFFEEVRSMIGAGSDRSFRVSEENSSQLAGIT